MSTIIDLVNTDNGATSMATINTNFDTLNTDKEEVSNKENTTLDTSTTKYPTNRLVKEYADGKVEDNIVDGHTTVAPSGNAVFDALALKASLTGTETLTNKRITPRVSATTSVASITPDISSYDVYELTAQNDNFTLNLPSVDEAGQTIVVRILTSSAKTLTINAGYKAENTLPTALASGKRYEFIINQFNTGGSKEYWITGIEF